MNMIIEGFEGITMKKTLLALALMGAASPALADSWLYAGVNYGTADFTESGAGNDVLLAFVLNQDDLVRHFLDTQAQG